MRLCLTLQRKKNKNLVFSLPVTNHYQKIKNLKIISPSYQIIKEKEWGNRVLIFHLNDVKDFSKIIFNLYPQSFKKTINKKFTLNDYQKMKIKIINNSFINGGDKEIKKLAKKIIGKEKELYSVIKKLYDFTLNYLSYGQPIDNLYSYRQALTKKTTDCGGFSTFLASLLQSLNIPCRLVVGFIIKKNLFTKFFSNFEFCILNFDFLMMHAWLEAQLPNKTWFPIDPSIEWRRKRGLTKRQGGFGFIPADRLVVSYGCDFIIKIDQQNYKIDLLQKPIYL